MIERFAVDSNALIAWFRSGNTQPLAMANARQIVLLLPVVGELYVGVFSSKKRETNLALVEAFISRHHILKPDEDTARLYGQLRARHRPRTSARPK